MTTIPNLNIVIQQGDSVRDSHNIRNQALEAAQHAAFQRLEDEDKKRTQVAQTEETEKILFNKESSNEGKRRQDQRAAKKQPEPEEKKAPADPDAPGRLLNTIV